MLLLALFMCTTVGYWRQHFSMQSGILSQFFKRDLDLLTHTHTPTRLDKQWQMTSCCCCFCFKGCLLCLCSFLRPPVVGRGSPVQMKRSRKSWEFVVFGHLKANSTTYIHIHTHIYINIHTLCPLEHSLSSDCEFMPLCDISSSCSHNREAKGYNLKHILALIDRYLLWCKLFKSILYNWIMR